MKTAEIEDYELVEGELIPLPGATPKHGKVRRRMERALDDYLQRSLIGEPFGEIDCCLFGDTVRRPDVSVFLHERLKQLDLDVIPVPFAPDIAVEVLSPSETATDVNRKIREYLSAGTLGVWIVDYVNSEVFIHTKAAIQVLSLADMLQSPLLPGFMVEVKSILGS